MQIPLDSITGDSYILGIQSKSKLVEYAAIWKANRWAPKKAKSFTIKQFIHTDYKGKVVKRATGFATIEVVYYTRLVEGKYVVNRNMPYPTTLPGKANYAN